MSALLGKAGKKLFERHLESYAPADPLYEFYTDEQGRQKRRKRELPPGLSERDARILRSVKRRAHYLDKGFSLCGLRFGWTFLISLIPVVGDITDASLNYFLVVRKARGADLPQWLIRRMMLNNAVSLAVSFVPFVGDVILAVFKANSRNAALLEEFLRLRGEEYLRLHPESEVTEATPSRKKSGGWFKSKKGQAGLTKKDAEQVKPGSGLEPGETIEPVEIAPAPPAIVEEEAPSPPQPDTTNGGRSFGALFKGRGRKLSTVTENPAPSPALAPPTQRLSRFVENVSGSSAAGSTS